MFKFYPAGKIWHAPKFQQLRELVDPVCITARWIDFKEDDDIVVNRKGDLWQACLEDVSAADYVLLYSEEHREEQRGALVEVGMAYGMGKPVYAIGSCQSTKPNAISDVAFTHHPLWNWVGTNDLIFGMYKAAAMHKWNLKQQAKGIKNAVC